MEKRQRVAASRIPNSRKAAVDVPPEQEAMLHGRLREKGYRSIREMTDRTGLTRNGEAHLISFETARRAFKAGEPQIADLSMALIMDALEFSVKAIDNELEKRGDKIIRRLIRGRKDPKLNEVEAAFISALQKIVVANQSAVEFLAGQLELLAKAASVDISEELFKLRDTQERRVFRKG